MAENCDPNALAAKAKCFQCVDGSLQEIQTYLLCQILNNGGTGGGGLPTGNAPAFTVVGNPTAAAAPRVDTTSPQILALGIGITPDITNPLKVLLDHQNVAGTWVADFESASSGGMSDLTGVKINTQLGGSTLQALSIQEVGVERASISWKGVISATGYNDTETALATTGAVAIDGNLGGQFTCALTGNVTFSFLNMASGRTFKVIVTGDASHTVTWPAAKWEGGVAPVQTLSKVDVYTFTIANGGTVYGSAVQNMS